MRSIIVLAVALFTLGGSVTAALATQSYRDWYLRGYVDPTRDTNIPYTVPRLGVNASLEQYSVPELKHHFDLMTSANVTWVRQIVRWDQVEQTKGVYNWDEWDVILNTLDQYSNLRPIIVLSNSPSWARTERSQEDPTAPPMDPNDFANFAAAFASRYSSIVDHYQIWDEPNLRDAWGYLDPQPSEYAALLRTSYQAIHANDDRAMVIAAALAPTTEQGPHNISDWLYLEQLYHLGASEFMDAIGAKPYGFDSSPLDRDVAHDILNFSRIVRLREIMVENGDGQKAIWASNWGWNTLPDNWDGAPSIWGNVSEQERIDYTLTSLAKAEREWLWLAGMTLQHWQPDEPANSPMWGFALVDQDGNPSELLTTLQTMGDHSPSHARDGFYPPETKYATYSGVWTFSEQGADVGWLKDSRFSFRFEGSDVALQVRRGDFVAYLYPEINTLPANRLPQDAAGNSYIILTSATRQNEIDLVTVSQNLDPQREHNLEVVVDRGWDQWILMGYAVSSGNLSEPFNRQIAIAWATAGIALASALFGTWNLRSHITNIIRIIYSPLRPISNFWHSVLSILASFILMGGMWITWGDGIPALLKRDVVNLPLSILSAGMLYMDVGWIITLLAAGVLYVSFVSRVDIGLILTLGWTPFFLFPVQLYTYAFPIAEVLLLLTFAAWLTRLIIRWAEHYSGADGSKPSVSTWRISIIDVGILLYAVAALLSLFWTAYTEPALTELRTMIVEPLLFYVMLRHQLTTKEQIIRICDMLIVSGLLAASIGLGMYLAGDGIITAEGGAERLAGIYGSPNNMALLLGRILPFALTYTLLLRSKQQKRSWLGASTLLVGLIALAFTQSAGGLFIGVPIAFIVVILIVYGKRATLPMILLIALVSASLLILLRFPRFSRLLDFSTGTNFFRLRVWQSGVNIIRDHTITGIGLDQFLYYFRSRYILPDAWQEPDLSHPHNFVLDIWTRLGILGILAFIWIQASFWRLWLKLFRDADQQSWQFAILVGVAGSMSNLLAHGLIDNSVFVNDLAMIFVFLVALPQLVMNAIQSEP